MKWTEWRRLASVHDWYDDDFDYDGPACYELGTGGPREGGWTLYYRAVACRSKRSARKLQDNLLRKFEYDWNTQLNGIDDND